MPPLTGTVLVPRAAAEAAASNPAPPTAVAPFVTGPLLERRTIVVPTGTDTLAVRERYFRRRRGAHRGWIPLWVTLGALLGWLFIAGFSLLGH